MPSVLMAPLTITMPMRQDLDFALDLLLARAALDEELHQQLIHDPEACCHRNGIELPAGVRLVITLPGQEVLVRAIPMNTSDAGLSKADQSTRELASAHFNSAETTTVTTEEAEVTVTVGPSVMAESTLNTSVVVVAT